MFPLTAGTIRGFKSRIISTQSVSNKTFLLNTTKCVLCLYHTEFLGPIGIVTIAFALDISHAASIIHVVNTVFVMKEPTIILFGNNRRIKVVYFCFE